MKNTPVSLEKIAKIAGFSKMTVSAALSGKKGVSELNRKKIKLIAEQLGYQANPMVSSMMSQVQKSRWKRFTPVVGFIVLRPRHWKFLHEIKEGIRLKTDQLGYQFQDFYMGEEGMTPELTAHILKGRNVEGIIVGDVEGSAIRLPIQFHDFVSVLLGGSIAKPDLNRVCTHYAKNLQQALDALQNLGYRKIGLFLARESDDRSGNIYSSVYTRTREFSPRSGQLVPLGLGESVNDQGSFRDWFLKYKPDAVLTVGRTASRCLYELRVKVPDEVGLAFLSAPPGLNCSGINPNYKLMASAAVELLDIQFRLNQRSTPAYPMTLSIPGYWVAGTTTTRRH